MPARATAAVSWTAALQDGRLLANIMAWADLPAAHTTEYPIGLVTSAGDDWATLVPVHPQLPGGADETAGSLSDLVATAMNGNAMDLFVSNAANGDLLESLDGGSSWSDTPAR